MDQQTSFEPELRLSGNGRTGRQGPGRLSAAQRRAFGRLSAALGLFGLFLPGPFLFLLYWLGFFAFCGLIAFRVLLVSAAVIAWVRRRPLSNRYSASDLPSYTVLVPLHREARSVATLVQSLRKLRYPKSKLDVIFLLEESDIETRSAAADARMPAHFRTLIVPRGEPQTKPRALNVGLQAASGHFITIYDAEDRPHPMQLRAAVDLFRQADARGERLGCVQAQLRPYNHRDSWIAAQFAREYAIQFRLLVPGLSALGLPVLIGGTSNHFRTETLQRLGGWDAYNVTEDADLGVRLARAGYTISTLDLPTLEEAPVAWGQWTNQRSRWIKGFLQTWLSAMRAPSDTLRELGWVRFLSLQVLLGGSILSSTVHGLMATLFLVALVTPDLQIYPRDWILLGSGYTINLACSLLALPRWRPHLLWAALTAPLYWPLTFPSAVRAYVEMLTRPHFWAKTRHAVTKERLSRSRSVFQE